MVSNVGDWLDFLALNALVAYRWNLGAGALAALTIARMLPLAACGPVPACGLTGCRAGR